MRLTRSLIVLLALSLAHCADNVPATDSRAETSRPRLDACLSCGMVDDYHCTLYRGTGGICPLCRQCFHALSPEERLPFYRSLFESVRGDESDWSDIERAVLEGK